MAVHQALIVLQDCVSIPLKSLTMIIGAIEMNVIVGTIVLENGPTGNQEYAHATEMLALLVSAVTVAVAGTETGIAKIGIVDALIILIFGVARTMFG